TAGIPRLQELTFLEETAKAVSDGCTFNRIRQILIDHMASLREHDTPTGNTAVFRMAKHDPYRYGNNASDALAELMRLGMVEKKVLPSKRTTIEAYANQKYVLTPKGEAWVARLKNSRTAAYDELLQALWAAHHQFAGYLSALARGMLVVPTANWTEVHSTPVGDEGRGAYVAFLAARAAGAVHQGVTGWNATDGEIRAAITDYVRAKVEAATRRQRPNPLPRNRDFIGACEEAL